MTFTSINKSRYIPDSKALLVEFLRYYIVADHVAILAHVGNQVHVYQDHPLPPEGENLTRPLVLVEFTGDNVVSTVFAVAGVSYAGEHHEMQFDITVYTDNATGAGTTRDDLVAAINQCLVKHGSELAAAGLTILDKSTETPGYEDEFFTGTVKITGDVDITGEKI